LYKEEKMLFRARIQQTIPLLIILSIITTACQATGAPEIPEPIVETLVVTEVVEATPVEVIQVVTPTREPAGPRTLVICMGNEPDGIGAYGGPSSQSILEAVFGGSYWGAIDSNSFTFQPILQEKLPSLADGDAAVVPVSVGEGDIVVDAAGRIVVLDGDADPPLMLIPARGGEPIPYQGGEFEMDQVSATFKLLPGLVWSDGAPITAADSTYAFNLMSHPDNDFSHDPLRLTESYEAIDDLTTVWTGLPGYSGDITYANFFGPAPEHLWGEYSVSELFESEEYTRRPVGWGPYVIDEWVEGESITLHKNTNYFRADEGLPKFDTLVYRFVGENSNANLAALLSGECDIIDSTASLDDQIELLLDLQASGKIKASFSPSIWWEHIDFGIQHVDYDDGYQMGLDRPDFFSDVRTRQAFAHCMDRQALVDTIFFGQTLVLDSFVQPQHPLHNPDVPRYQFDVEAGNALLEEAGWLDHDGDPITPRVAQGVANIPDGTPLEVAYEATPAPLRQQVAAILKNSLAQCGIKANVQHIAPIELYAVDPEGKLYGRRFDLVEVAWFLPWCGYFMSSQITGPPGETWVSILDGLTRTFPLGWDGFNFPGYANQDYDAACNAFLGSLPGQPGHEAAYQEAQRIFAENLPAVPLFPRIQIDVSRPDMCGFIVDPTASTEFWNIEEFDYGEGCEE
jgi:peptide/nickel transport system substrate-binding protein